MATMQEMDAGAWCAGLPMARWSKCYYPRGVMQLFGEGPHDVNDKINSPIISKKKRNLKVLCSSLIFILLVVGISLMVFFIIDYKDNSTTLSTNTAITKNVNVLNTITIFTTGNRSTPSNTTEGAAKSRLDVGTAVQSLERKRWLSPTGKNARLGPSVTKETSEAGGNSADGIPNETKQEQSDISVEVLGTNNETKVAVSTIISGGDGGMIVEKTNISAPLQGPSSVFEATEYHSNITIFSRAEQYDTTTILSTPERHNATTISSTPQQHNATIISSIPEQDHAITIPSTLEQHTATTISSTPEQDHATKVLSTLEQNATTIIPSTPEQNKTATIPSTTERYNTTTISSTDVHYNITSIPSTPGQSNNTTISSTAEQYKNTSISSTSEHNNTATALTTPGDYNSTTFTSSTGRYNNTDI